MLSVVIPAYHEPYLNKTIESVINNATGDIEIIPVLDGWIGEGVISNKKVKPIFLMQNQGKRNALNVGFAASKGEFVMSLDAHCIVEYGFDEVLTNTCRENWLMIPRRYSLNPNTWQRDATRPFIDYHHLSFPTNGPWGFGMYARQWEAKTWSKKDPKYDIDDDMTMQASCFMANRKYFMKNIFPLDDKNYGPLAQDQQELVLKYWLYGGEVKVNKKTWYGHVAKRWYHYSNHTFSRKHKKDKIYIKGNTWGTWHWLNNKKFTTYIESFCPVPHWPDDWEKVILQLKESHVTI